MIFVNDHRYLRAFSASTAQHYFPLARFELNSSRGDHLASLLFFFFLAKLVDQLFFIASTVQAEFRKSCTLNLWVASEWIERFSDGFAGLLSFFFCFVDCLVLFVRLVTADAAKGALEAEAAAFRTLCWIVWLVLSVSVFAFAARSPGVDVEPFSSWEPPLAHFFWSTWNEGEPFAITLVALGHGFLRG